MKQSILLLSTIFLGLSITLQSEKAFQEDNNIIEYETINLKNISSSKNIIRNEENTIELDNLLTSIWSLSMLSAEESKEEQTELKLEEVEFEKTKNSKVEEKKEEPPVIVNPWRFPVEVGTITQYPHSGHVAYDITSPRGYGEVIYPVADGVISSIYTDPAGALIVMVRHNINGVIYTSQYAHLSRYASGLYIGKPVTSNDPLGWMGTTGYSTGVHLHLVVLDCDIYNPADARCSSYNNYKNYVHRRLNEGYIGLGSHIAVPPSWNTR